MEKRPILFSFFAPVFINQTQFCTFMEHEKKRAKKLIKNRHKNKVTNDALFFFIIIFVAPFFYMPHKCAKIGADL